MTINIYLNYVIKVYHAFLENKKSSKWCYKHFLNYHSLLQAVSVRGQLVKYFHRFNLPIKSCEGDIDRLRKCIVTGFFSQAAKLQMDGSYKTVRDDVVNINIYIYIFYYFY